MQASTVFSTLIEPLRRAIAEEGYTEPTPIQEQAIPPLVEGRDLLGCAQTGTGKTAAFALPLLQALSRSGCRSLGGRPRALILTPTRELAAQIGDSIRAYGRHASVSHTVVFGGVGQRPQELALRSGPDVVVATPGRLLDLMEQGHAKLDRIEMFVLDEADRMLDLGFMPAVRRVIARLPERRHSLFFSATMPPTVATLAQELLREPVRIDIDPGRPTVERIAQKLMFVDKDRKDDLLHSLIREHAMDRALVFTRTKHGADKVVRKLASAGIAACAMHGNKSQSARVTALQEFKSGRVRVLVATDIAARGLDVDSVTHVVNYDLPEEPETYVHRIGRTARAGASGCAVSFCSAHERDALRDIERTIRKSIPADLNHARHSEAARHASGAAARPAPRKPQGRRPKGPSASRRFGRASARGGSFAPRSSSSMSRIGERRFR